MACKRFDPIYLELSRAMEGITLFQRRFFPPEISRLREDLVQFKDPLREARQEIQKMIEANGLEDHKNIIIDAINLVLAALETIFNASTTDFQETITQVMRAFRKVCRAQEKLYPLCLTSPHLSRFFLEPGFPDPAEIYDPKPQGKALVGLHHFGVEDNYYARGAVSLYIPEYYDEAKKWPIILALHGGFGHGRDFIWSWLREVRTRGFILICPTSRDTTWSILDPEVDAEALIRMIDFLKQHHHFDMDRVLLTGISDGGTFALLCSLLSDTPFTAFAPVASVLAATDISSAKGKHIYWVHGALDWMFPVQRAREGSNALERVGADVTLLVIDDLSHTYPHDQNKHILNWFDQIKAVRHIKDSR